jgi:cellulose synthase/poly-beta-1,6-N-acetylglucosamine synthase-like glycosyltransferase
MLDTVPLPIKTIPLLSSVPFSRLFIALAVAVLYLSHATGFRPQDLITGDLRLFLAQWHVFSFCNQVTSWAGSQSLYHVLDFDFLSDSKTVVFIFLFAFRYVRLVVHIISFWLFYRPAPVPKNPSLSPSDCTIILPTVDPKNPDFEECINSCLHNKPGAIIVVTIGDKLTKLTKEIVAPFKELFPATVISVETGDEANKRCQIAHGLQFVKTKITILLDDHVFWPSERFLPTVLAPFEDPKVGIVGTNKLVRRTDTGFNIRSFWNMLGAIYLERRNFDSRATNAIDGGVCVVSGRTSAHRTSILQDPKFLSGFTNERFFFNIFGPLNADDDNFITRWDVCHGWKIKIQYGPDALIETTLGTYPKFLSQCLRWARTTWRSNSDSLFTDRTVWYTQPWCIYAEYLTSFFNFALFYDSLLAYTLFKSKLGTQTSLVYLGVWIFFTKMVKLTPYFLREPQDLIMLPGYFAFAYFHSLIKLYAGLTFWKTNWGGRNLAAIDSKKSSPPSPQPAWKRSPDTNRLMRNEERETV